MKKTKGTSICPMQNIMFYVVQKHPLYLGFLLKISILKGMFVVQFHEEFYFHSDFIFRRK